MVPGHGGGGGGHHVVSSWLLLLEEQNCHTTYQTSPDGVFITESSRVLEQVQGLFFATGNSWLFSSVSWSRNVIIQWLQSELPRSVTNPLRLLSHYRVFVNKYKEQPKDVKLILLYHTMPQECWQGVESQCLTNLKCYCKKLLFTITQLSRSPAPLLTLHLTIQR